MDQKPGKKLRIILGIPILAACVLAVAAAAFIDTGPDREDTAGPVEPVLPPGSVPEPRLQLDSSGFGDVMSAMEPWGVDASLEEVARSFRGVGFRALESLDKQLKLTKPSDGIRLTAQVTRAALWNFEGKADRAYETLTEARKLARGNQALAANGMASLLFLQGVASLRLGENENCVECRGESSCILPISEAARHRKPRGSRLAIEHFTEYLGLFPDDLEARWLLNIAHMTLGEYPDQVDGRYRIDLERFENSEFDLGRFRDVGHLVGVNHFSQAGGAILDDFDNDGRLDLFVTTWEATEPALFYRNQGDGTFEECGEEAGLAGQLGGLNCVQADFDNDGFLDVFIPRGAWLRQPIRPSLLRNKGDGTFEDVTRSAGMMRATNSNSACWADYDNDGLLDLFVCSEKQPHLLYRNTGGGAFEEIGERAGVAGLDMRFGKGAVWFDHNNDDRPDLFVNNLSGPPQLFENRGNGTFEDVASALGVDGPRSGFSCWAFDYDNDGWLDLMATCYRRTLKDVVNGLIGEPHETESNGLYRNLEGNGFEDTTKAAGLDLVFAAMGSNYGDFDNDGFLDFYLGTGEPNLATLIPNRMFRNVDGSRFAEITASSGTGHLQKGHGVACGDWDRDGDVDVFIQMGGATNGDEYHNILFQNPGQGNRSVTVKLKGRKTNRSALGARIKAVTTGDSPRTIHRHVASGSSFGANPLEQVIGLGQAEGLATLEIHWPTSGTTQTFRDIPAGRWIEVTEFEGEYRAIELPPIPQPE